MKKIHIVIAVIIIALAIGGAYYFISSNSKANVGNSTFKLPNGFKVNGNQTATKSASMVKIDNKKTLLKVAEYKKPVALNKAVKSFKKHKKGSVIETTNFDAGNTNIKAKKVVCRSNNTNNTNNTKEKVSVCYFVTKGNSTYYIQSKSNNKSIDAIVREIILSIDKK